MPFARTTWRTVRTHLRPVPVLLPVLAFALTSCGGGSGSSTGAQPRAADVAGARKAVEAYRDVPAFRAPGPAFDAAGKLRGKTIFEIPITSEVPFVSAVERGMREAAGSVGARLVVFPNQGRPSQWVVGIQTAIAQHASAITLLAQDPRLLGPQIAQAGRAGIPVVVLRTTGESEPCQADSAGRRYGAACVPGPFEQAGRLEADWVIADADGHANVLVITSRDARSTQPLLSGLTHEFRARCASCRIRYVDVPIADWATRIQTDVQSALVRDPKTSYVVPIYDSMSQFVVPAIRAAGASDRVKIATFNGTPFVLALLQKGQIVAMDAGENLAWLGWAAMDQAFRVVAGAGPARSEHTALRVFDRRNVGATGNPPRYDEGYGKAYVSGYRRLWGVGG